MPLASCPLFRACGPQLPGDWFWLMWGLWVATGIWLTLFLGIGMGRR